MQVVCLAPALTGMAAVLADADMEGLHAIAEAIAFVVAIGMLAVLVIGVIGLVFLAAYIALGVCYVDWAAAPLWRVARCKRLPQPVLAQVCAVALPCLQLVVFLLFWFGLPAGLLCLVACPAGIAAGIWVLILLNRMSAASALPHASGAFAACTSFVVLHFLFLCFAVCSLLLG